MIATYNDDYTTTQRDLVVESHGKHVATVTVIDGRLWYTNELDGTEYLLLEIAPTGAIITNEPTHV
jgi:hypothetical protein